MTNLDPRVKQLFDERNPFELTEKNLISFCRIGSHSHGTHIPSTSDTSIDDIDYMGVVLPPIEYAVGYKSFPKSNWQTSVIKFEELDMVFYSLQHYLHLLTKQNPNVLGLTWLRDEDTIVSSPTWQWLKDTREFFLSKRLYPSFKGLILNHFDGIEKSEFKGYMGEKRKKIVEQFGYDIKDAQHTIRILKMAIECLETGKLNVFRSEDRDFLKEIKSGKFSKAEILALKDELMPRFEAAYQNSELQDELDMEYIEALILTMVADAYEIPAYVINPEY